MWQYYLQCSGRESHIAQCLRIHDNSCIRYLYLECSGPEEDISSFVHVTSDDVSRIEHVVFDGVSMVQVSGRRPVVNDVKLERSQRGLVYFGSARNANEDTVCTDITVTDVRRYFLALCM